MNNDNICLLSLICSCVEPKAELVNLCTIKVKSSACVCTPKCISEIAGIVSICKELKLPIFVLGNGSKVVFTEKFCGVVISTSKFDNIKIADKISEDTVKIFCGAGVKLSKINELCAKNNLSGLEWSFGIPATIGGATYMNAGAFGGEFANVVQSVIVYENGRIKKYKKDELNFSYRYSSFQKSTGIILEVELLLHKGQNIFKQQLNFLNQRKNTQPLNVPSCGSVFKKQQDFIPAKCIDKLGLKSVKIGGAEISAKHAGFIVNSANAKGSDVLELARFARKKIFEATGNIVDTEIVFVGKNGKMRDKQVFPAGDYNDNFRGLSHPHKI
ncbi:MAG: UDP-N-acetylmuramate dehydrogenase [Clostridia bacterium]